MRPAWYDIEMRGRRLEAVSRRMNTQFYKFLDNKEFEMALAFADRLIKIDHTLQPYIEQMTGAKKFLKQKEKEDYATA